MTGFAGFDSYSYPGEQAMTWLRANTNLCWCGFYVAPAPNHPDTSWMPHRAFLAQNGWGLLPTYLGQQTVGNTSKINTAAKGQIDGTDAAAKMAASGFPAGSFVYLDIEDGSQPGTAVRAYIGAWVDAVTGAGFGPGIYCSHKIALELHQLRPAARIWAFFVTTTVPHQVPGTNFSDAHPAGSGFPGSFAWQHTQNAVIGSGPGHTLQVDLSTAITSDPSR